MGHKIILKLISHILTKSFEVPMYDHGDGVEICIPTSDLGIDTFYDPDLFDDLALDKISVDVSVHTAPVRG